MGDTGRDPRYRSGEHLASEGDSTDSLQSLQTNGAVTAEIKAHRREVRQALGSIQDLMHTELDGVRKEMSLQFKHFGTNLENIVATVRDITKSLNDGREHCASHDSAITAVNKRVDRLETVEQRYAKSSSTATGSTSASNPNFWAALASNPWIAWAIAALLLGLFLLAAITGRPASTFNPMHSPSPSHGPAASGQESPKSGVAKDG